MVQDLGVRMPEKEGALLRGMCTITAMPARGSCTEAAREASDLPVRVEQLQLARCLSYMDPHAKWTCSDIAACPNHIP